MSYNAKTLECPECEEHEQYTLHFVSDHELEGRCGACGYEGQPNDPGEST